MPFAFAAHLEILPVEDRALAVIGEAGCDVYTGEAFARLGAQLDGTLSENELTATVPEQERDAVRAALAQLQKAGVIVEAPPAGEAATAIGGPDGAWWASQRLDPGTVATRLATTSLAVTAVGQIDAGPLRSAIQAAGIPQADEPDLRVVLVEDYLDPRLAEVNLTALDSGQRWLLAQPTSARTLVGPVLCSDDGPCWECLAARLRHNRSAEFRLRWMVRRDGPPATVPAPSMQRGLGAALVATEVARFLAGARPDLTTTVLSFDGRTWQGESHHVPWRPQCPACGAGELPLDRPVTPIRIHRNGTGDASGSLLRSVAPPTTLQRFEQHISPLTGALRRLHRARGPEHLHAYSVEGSAARIHGDRQGWESFGDVMMAGGKGTSDEAARASALCEALERYSGNFFGDEPRRRATLAQMGEAAIAPNDYMHYSERQFAERGAWNERAGSYRTRVPEPFDREVEIDWSPVWSISGERERWLPTGLCYYGARVAGAEYCIAESNGNAAGNTIEEAILHGMLELVERDHVALWWYNRTPAPGVDLDSLDDPWLARLRAQIADEGRRFWVLDLTADLGLPAAAALVASEDGSGVGMGLGAHLDLRSAVVRAATELAQLGLGAPSGGLGHGHDALHLDDHPFTLPDPSVPLRSCADEDPFSGDVIDALEHARRAIEGSGMELLVLDQTRPDVGLPVAKVVVPQMRHFWPRFGPGRLFEVPVALGRLSEPTPEEELNPVPPTP